MASARVAARWAARPVEDDGPGGDGDKGIAAGSSARGRRPRDDPRRRHQVNPRRLAVEADAATASIGGAGVRLAKGTAAALVTIQSSRRSTTQPGAARTAPTATGAPDCTRAPPAIATRPTAIAGATSGTTARLTRGARIASRPNDTRITGSVAAWAASETPRLSASQRGSRPRPAASIQSVSGVAHAMRPAVANDESWNPASRMSPGSVRSSSTAAQPSAAAARPARPVSRASRTTPAIRAARTTEADAPANATYA